MNFIIIIPARFSSLRLPGKPLLDINGKPMIVHVMEKALASKAKRVVIATDHIDIVNIIKIQNTDSETFLTKLNHRSGIERIHEVINYYSFSDEQIIVNIQGDEPLISSSIINKVANILVNVSDVHMATLATPISSDEDMNNSNIVKVVSNINNHALYFSRSIIPFHKHINIDNKKINFKILRHVGIYSYRAGFIRRYVKWPISYLEQIEDLEQLRVLWYGEKIYVLIINNVFTIGVDSLEDLLKVRLVMNNMV